MTIFRCQIHQIQFGAEGIPSHEVDCPKYTRQKIEDLETKYADAVQHRDALLRAIEIKQTVVPVTTP